MVQNQNPIDNKLTLIDPYLCCIVSPVYNELTHYYDSVPSNLLVTTGLFGTCANDTPVQGSKYSRQLLSSAWGLRVLARIFQLSGPLCLDFLTYTVILGCEHKIVEMRAGICQSYVRAEIYKVVHWEHTCSYAVKIFLVMSLHHVNFLKSFGWSHKRNSPKFANIWVHWALGSISQGNHWVHMFQVPKNSVRNQLKDTLNILKNRNISIKFCTQNLHFSKIKCIWKCGW